LFLSCCYWKVVYWKKTRQWPQSWSRHSNDHVHVILLISIIMKKKNIFKYKFVPVHCFRLRVNAVIFTFYFFFYFVSSTSKISDFTSLSCCFLDRFHNFRVNVQFLGFHYNGKYFHEMTFYYVLFVDDVLFLCLYTVYFCLYIFLFV